jgi:hypothetical protein
MPSWVTLRKQVLVALIQMYSPAQAVLGFSEEFRILLAVRLPWVPSEARLGVDQVV